jgi:hypothetical protein
MGSGWVSGGLYLGLRLLFNNGAFGCRRALWGGRGRGHVGRKVLRVMGGHVVIIIVGRN